MTIVVGPDPRRIGVVIGVTITSHRYGQRAIVMSNDFHNFHPRPIPSDRLAQTAPLSARKRAASGGCGMPGSFVRTGWSATMARHAPFPRAECNVFGGMTAAAPGPRILLDAVDR
jgi:hypothetical protein